MDKIKNWLQELGEKLRRFMAGRYGTDEFSRFTFIVTGVLLIISIFARGSLFYLLALAGLGYSYFRVLSKDYGKRRAENEWFLRKAEALRKGVRVQKRRFDERREFHYFKCPGCSQQVRVPRGKGHIRITCPKCRTQFDRTT